MKNSDKAFIQAYNGQISVDTDSRIILGAYVTTAANDKEEIESQYEQILNNTNLKPDKVLADAGYFSEDNLEYLADKRIESFIPPDRIKHNEWKTQKAPAGVYHLI